VTPLHEQNMRRARALQALLDTVLHESHDDHCGATCRVDLDGHDCCYDCNLVQETVEEFARVAKRLMRATEHGPHDGDSG
jgi:hypothetical protein